MRFSHIFIILNALILLIFCAKPIFAQKNEWTVVLDPGHGGKDPGAVYGGFNEKDINLSVVLKTGKILQNDKSAKINVIYTRKTDKFIELASRSKIANNAKADLFVSVHVNASANSKANGTETFVMGVDKSNANLGVAMRENGVISLENNYTSTYEGYDPNSTESLIMFTLMQYAYTQESLVLAEIMQNKYSSLKTQNRGVKQAGFLVLWNTSMPSVLTELGFLSNSSDREYLTTETGQQKIAQALAQSIIKYVNSNQKAPVVTTTSSTTTTSQTTQTTTTTQKNENRTPSPYVSYGVIVKSNPDVPRGIGAHYAVQIRASKTQVEINLQNFSGVTSVVRERKIKGLFKYTVGELYRYNDAVELLKNVKKQFPDAFLVAFDKKANPISITEAKKIIENK